MDNRRTQNAAVAHFNPWITECIQPKRPNSGRKFVSGSTLGTVGIDRATPISITSSTESPTDGIVLAACGLVIRVAFPGCDDAKEFLCRGGKWISEDREPVEIHLLAHKNYHDHTLTRACLLSEQRKHRLYLVPGRRASLPT